MSHRAHPPHTAHSHHPSDSPPPQHSPSTMVHFHMRNETKEGERRTALTPKDAKTLIEAGHKLTVESFPDRCFPDADYKAAGAQLVPSGAWDTPDKVEKDAIVLGLKELPDGKRSLPHRHIMFAHCFKDQDGWVDVMRNFVQGGGKLYDLEFLKDEAGRRKVAFGRSAGFCGMGAGILAWANQSVSNSAMTAATFPRNLYYPQKDLFIAHAKRSIAATGRQPRIMIIGALGRCGNGAVEMALEAGVPESNILKWDLAETKKGGPFEEILSVDIFVNCIYLDPTSTTPAFLTKEMLAKQRTVSLMVDVSCDPNNPKNPVPVYDEITFLKSPTKRVIEPELPKIGSSVKALRDLGVEGFGSVVKAGATGKVRQSTEEGAGLEVVIDGEKKGVFAYTAGAFGPVEGKLGLPFDVIAIDHLPSLVPCESSDDFSSGLLPLLLDLEKDSEKVWSRALEVFEAKAKDLPAEEK
eukprot:TRINITY_DN979_c2_g1_i1.p1 TRINITY_DN979_c2_g1~~TRINITY_DN979_c2_g1_i1.p1  ORF type:complete len:467 (+),score=160.87 TRINITY_DN979_c2_g1_i1:116-1516(+)